MADRFLRDLGNRSNSGEVILASMLETDASHPLVKKSVKQVQAEENACNAAFTADKKLARQVKW